MIGYFDSNIRKPWMNLRQSLGIKTISIMYEEEDVHIPVKRFNRMDGCVDDVNGYYPRKPIRPLEEILQESKPF